MKVQFILETLLRIKNFELTISEKPEKEFLISQNSLLILVVFLFLFKNQKKSFFSIEPCLKLSIHTGLELLKN